MNGYAAGTAVAPSNTVEEIKRTLHRMRCMRRMSTVLLVVLLVAIASSAYAEWIVEGRAAPGDAWRVRVYNVATPIEPLFAFCFWEREEAEYWRDWDAAQHPTWQFRIKQAQIF